MPKLASVEKLQKRASRIWKTAKRSGVLISFQGDAIPSAQKAIDLTKEYKKAFGGTPSEHEVRCIKDRADKQALLEVRQINLDRKMVQHLHSASGRPTRTRWTHGFGGAN
ncbi:MAG: hypothetical protein AAF549_03345 [Pseudomonadota bacterium]